MSDLKKYFTEYKFDQRRGIHKNLSLFAVYENLLGKYRNKEVVLVEIGIGHGE